MKKEKKVRTYQRRTKTGKLVTVKQHTAKYDAAEKAKEMLKKKGAGDELSAKKKAKPASSSAGELDFSQADFKAWYHWDQENDPKNPTALKVEKALKAKMGAKAYRKYFNDMSDSYSARGHLKAYKECSSCGDKADIKNKEAKAVKVKETKTSKKEAPKEKSVGLKAVDTKLARRVMKEEDFDSLREAKSYLADMPKSSYDRYVKLYAERDAKEKSKVGSVEGIAKYTSSKAGKTGFTRLMGSQASSAKKTLLENGYTEVRGVPEYRPDGTKRGTFTGLIGPNGETYLYRGGGMSPALLVKADKSKKKDILEWHKTKTSPKSEKPTKSSTKVNPDLEKAAMKFYGKPYSKLSKSDRKELDEAYSWGSRMAANTTPAGERAFRKTLYEAGRRVKK